jgi:phosphoglucomutase
MGRRGDLHVQGSAARLRSAAQEDAMTTVREAGKPLPEEEQVDIAGLLSAYHALQPDPVDPSQRVAFGTSGHRGSSVRQSYNESHILAICQAVVDYRRAQGITGPLFIGRDTHALSQPTWDTALEVFTANGVHLAHDDESPYTPTPVISHAILVHNRDVPDILADGVVITPSHNPPEDGGFKYNSPNGGPADTDATGAIERRANELLASGLTGVRRLLAPQRAEQVTLAGRRNLLDAYVGDLGSVLDMDAIAGSGVRIGIDPLGGSSVAYWDRIADWYGIDIEVVNTVVDPTFAFMPRDWDGKVRMDCSSPHAMAGLIALKDRFDIAAGADPDADRHGIVTPSAGLMNPNHFLAVAVWYLFQHRPRWSAAAGIGKTLVSSSMIDRVATHLDRRLVEVPVGFKWFVPGLLDGSIAFGGEESAGASFVRMDGTTWTTDKDGILMCLLAAEIAARTGRDPGELYGGLEGRFGSPVYERTDAPATPAQKAALKGLSLESITAGQLAGEPIVAKLSHAPGNGAAVGGVKVVTRNGWFAARPSGTEAVYKIYAESFLGRDHLRRIQDEARAMVDGAFTAGGDAAAV